MNGLRQVVPDEVVECRVVGVVLGVFSDTKIYEVVPINEHIFEVYVKLDLVVAAVNGHHEGAIVAKYLIECICSCMVGEFIIKCTIAIDIRVTFNFGENITNWASKFTFILIVFLKFLIYDSHEATDTAKFLL